MVSRINLNADMGEGFGAYDIGDDRCHSQDHPLGERGLRLPRRRPPSSCAAWSCWAREEGVSVGAHPGFNDLWGCFGAPGAST